MINEAKSFKVGDIVKVVKPRNCKSYEKYINIIGKITRISKNISGEFGYILENDSSWLWYDDELELQEETLKEKFVNLAKKQPLVFEIVYDNGTPEKGLLIPIYDKILFKDGFYDNLNDFSNDLFGMYDELDELDGVNEKTKIIRVYKVLSFVGVISLFNKSNLKLIWEREKEIPEYTMEELVEKVGYEFKIKK